MNVPYDMNTNIRNCSCGVDILSRELCLSSGNCWNLKLSTMQSHKLLNIKPTICQHNIIRKKMLQYPAVLGDMLITGSSSLCIGDERNYTLLSGS